MENQSGAPAVAVSSAFEVRTNRTTIHDGAPTTPVTRSSDAGTVDASEREIRLVRNPDGQWTARDIDVEVSAQGATRAEALDALDAVVAALDGDSGHAPTDEELRELGVDPATTRTQDDDLPDVLE